MNSTYTPSTVPYDMYGSVIALLCVAADIVATEPDVRDAVGMAAFRTDATRQTYRTAEKLAVRIASSRYGILPAAEGPRHHQWSAWQEAIAEPWPVLADAAGRYFGPDDAAAGITPGRWVAAV